MKLAACPKLSLRPENRIWFRAFDPKHIVTPLGAAHTVTFPTRFSPGPHSLKPFQIMYFSENHVVCLREVEALLGSLKMTPFPNPSSAWTIINVSVSLQRVADLTVPGEQKRLGTTAQELTGDWEGYQMRNPLSSVPHPVGTAPTQDLGEALFSIPGIEGFRTLSAKVPDQRNLVVFPQKLLKGSRLEYRDGGTGVVHEIVGKL